MPLSTSQARARPTLTIIGKAEPARHQIRYILGECHQEDIADQLQRIFRPWPAGQELDNYGSVATSQRAP
jgi:hypothetical protein